MALDFKKRFDIGLALMVCLALPGCVLLEAVPTPDGRVCNVSYDCLCVGCGANESFGCNGGVCSAICNTDSDCASEVCLGGYCQQEAECEVDADCAENNSNLCVQSTCNKGMCNTNTVNCPLPESYCGESGYVTFSRYCFPQSGCGLQQEIVPYESLDTTQYECQEALEGCDPDACEAAMGQCQTFLECTHEGYCRYGLLTHGATFSALCSMQGNSGVCISGVCIDPANATAENSCNLEGGVQDASYDGGLGNMATCSGENVTESDTVTSGTGGSVATGETTEGGTSATVDVPANAASEDITILATNTNITFDDDAGGDLTILSGVVSFTVEGTTSYTFNADVTITIAFSVAAPETCADNLSLAFCSANCAVLDNWSMLDGSSIVEYNTAANICTVTGTTSHFTYFAVGRSNASEGQGEEESGSDEERVAKPPTHDLFYSYVVDGVWQPLEGVTRTTSPELACAQAYGDEANSLFSATVTTVETVPFHKEDCTGNEGCTVEEQVGVFACVPVTNSDDEEQPAVYRVVRPGGPGDWNLDLHYLFAAGDGFQSSELTGGAPPLQVCTASYPDQDFNSFMSLGPLEEVFTNVDGGDEVESVGTAFKCRYRPDEEELNEYVPPASEEFATNNINLTPHGCTYNAPASNEKNYEVCNGYLPDVLRHAAPPAAWEEIREFLRELSVEGDLLGGVCEYNSAVTQEVVVVHNQGDVAGKVESKVQCHGQKDAVFEGCDGEIKQTLSTEEQIAKYERTTAELAQNYSEGQELGLCVTCLQNADCMNAVMRPAEKVLNNFPNVSGIDAYHPLTKATYCVGGSCRQCIHQNDCSCPGNNVPSCDNGTCVCGN